MCARHLGDSGSLDALCYQDCDCDNTLGAGDDNYGGILGQTKNQKKNRYNIITHTHKHKHTHHFEKHKNVFRLQYNI